MLKWLGFLQITEEASSKYEKTDIKMSTASVPANKNVQAIMLKSMVPDLGWFNRDWTKFEDWWRGVRLDLKSNRIIETNDRITVILAYLKRGIVGIYTQKKLKELDKELGIQDWDDFMKEIKTTFSNKTKVVLSSQIVDLVFLYFTFQFYFHSVLFFYFLFLEQLGLGLIGHAVTSVTTWWYSHKTDYET